MTPSTGDLEEMFRGNLMKYNLYEMYIYWFKVGGYVDTNAPINVMPHLPPPEPGGDKGGDLTDNSDPTHGGFDLSVYYTPWYSYSF